jgi:HAE1 family hydrophobic/amphiphilic exporter-1
MLCARVLSDAPRDATARRTLGRRAYESTGRLLAGLENAYKRALHVSLNHRVTVVAVAVALMVAVLPLTRFIGVELMPATDEGEVRVDVEMQVGTRLDLLDRKFQFMEQIVNESVPEIRNVVVNVGGSRWYGGGGHTGDIRIALVRQSERTRSSQQIADDLRKRLSGIPGVTVRTRAGQGLSIMRMGTAEANKVVVEIRGHDFATADLLARRVNEIVADVEGVADTRISRDPGGPEEEILIDRQKAADMHLTVSRIANALQTILSGTQAGYYRQAGDEFTILVKLRDAEKADLRDILDLTLTNADGQPVVLRNVVDVAPQTGPVLIEHKDQERIITVTAEVSGRDMGSVIADIRERLRSVPVPSEFTISFGGDYEEQHKSFRELLFSCILALVLVYMVMACQYESLRDPFVVMFSVPLAAIGVILILFYTGTTFNVQSFIGCIMLGGIVVNNAILLVDHTNLLRRRDGMPIREAIEEAGRRRLRPILMTASTTIIGLVPLALGLGEGGEAQAPMARAVIGGLLSSTLITLVFVPVVYSLFERRAWRAEARGRGDTTNVPSV